MKKVSVIIPLYNAEYTIEKTLDSIRTQTIPHYTFEIIVVNDGSTDNSKDVVTQYILNHPKLDIHLIHQANQGVSKARNTGLKHCKGDYIAFLDSDDEWFPEKTEHQLYFLEKPKYNLDFISSLMVGYKLLPPYFVKGKLAPVTFRKLMFRNGIPPSTVLFKRKIIDELGFFDEKQNYAEDANYWLKISEHYKMAILNESLVIAGGGKRTFGVSGLSANLKEMAKGFQKNLKDMYLAKRISFLEFQIYKIFYKMKYLVLKIRTKISK